MGLVLGDGAQTPDMEVRAVCSSSPFFITTSQHALLPVVSALLLPLPPHCSQPPSLRLCSFHIGLSCARSCAVICC